jgi:hypothetical protein
VGSVIAFFPNHSIQANKITQEILSFFGFILIIFGFFFISEKMPFPSFYTLIPVGGTALLLAFCNANTLIGRILSTPVFKFFGLTSYSLYLWHQPLLAFIRLKTMGQPANILLYGAVICSIFLAYLSWKFVETPFRNKKKFTQKSVFILSGVCLLMLLAFGAAGHIQKGYIHKFPEVDYASQISSSPKRNACHSRWPDQACRYFGKNIEWATLGDSHVVEFSYALAKHLESQDKGLLHLSYSACPPALLFDNSLLCTKWFTSSLEYLEANPQIKNIVIGFRHQQYLNANSLESFFGKRSFYFKDPANSLTKEEAQQIYWNSLYTSIRRLLNAGKTIYLLYPIPQLPDNINKLITPFCIFTNKLPIDISKTIAFEDYQNSNNFIIQKLDSLQNVANIKFIKTSALLCRDNYCPAISENQALYFDDNHLSVFGAELLLQRAPEIFYSEY